MTFAIGDRVLFTDRHVPENCMLPGSIEEVLTVPSGQLYVVRLDDGRVVQPVFPEELSKQGAPA